MSTALGVRHLSADPAEIKALSERLAKSPTSLSFFEKFYSPRNEQYDEEQRNFLLHTHCQLLENVQKNKVPEC